MPILVGIDGTGGGTLRNTARNRRYDIEFLNSFVSKLCKHKSNAWYERGPVNLGGGLDSAIMYGLRFIEQKRSEMGNDEPILLTGYSRGALGVMVIAQRLQRQGINVRAAILFDCVDRHGDYDAAVVPNNIEHLFHVIRNPAANSRHSFGNDAMMYRQPTIYYGAYMFMCTHGGMGGTPWLKPADKKPTDLIDEGALEHHDTTAISYQQDVKVSEDVWGYCQPFLHTHEFI